MHVQEYNMHFIVTLTVSLKDKRQRHVMVTLKVSHSEISWVNLSLLFHLLLKCPL